jgi:hypothetical protein
VPPSGNLGTTPRAASASDPKGTAAAVGLGVLDADGRAIYPRSCRKGRYVPPVRMIKLTATQEITPYKWVHPDEDR